MKIENKELFDKIGKIQKDIDDNIAEIEVLKNYNKYVENLKTGISTTKKFELLKNMKKNSINSQDALFSAASDLQREINQREYKLNFLKEENEDKKIEKEDLMLISKEIKDQTKVYKEELENIKKKLMLHYHILLSEGKDTRSEGLVWIIKSIWNLGEDVIMTYLPNYLDEKCINFLFYIAHKDFELLKMNEDLDLTKKNLKNSLAEIGIKNKSCKKKSTKKLIYDPKEKKLVKILFKYNLFFRMKMINSMLTKWSKL